MNDTIDEPARVTINWNAFQLHERQLSDNLIIIHLQEKFTFVFWCELNPPEVAGLFAVELAVDLFDLVDLALKSCDPDKLKSKSGLLPDISF